ncbi:hypothetical protein Taro_016938 [Colocasia esculenta]|uniref:Uncharacterized protein n=1 Tax=Colocasia esculenta TaxID=4460 RepID=A0A843UM69_COLES|nr:hypothetical protein [Colocasia esculenta]
MTDIWWPPTGGVISLDTILPPEHANRIKEAEAKRLVWTDVPAALISVSFLRREFPTLAGTAQALRLHSVRRKISIPAEWNAYVGALKPLARHDSGSTTSRGDSVPPDAALSSPILPGDFNNELWPKWERHIRHSIAHVGPIDFINQVENGTKLLDLWDVMAGIGKVVKLPPEGVVLQPTFSPAPSASFVHLSEKQKQAASYNKKRRASKEASPLQRAARGRTSKPSSSSEEAFLPSRNKGPIEDTPHEDTNALADDDYNPTFDGTPSPDGAGLPRASPLKQGHTSASVVANEKAGCPNVNTSILDGSTLLQVIHDLLTSRLETELPDCPDFNFIYDGKN